MKSMKQGAIIGSLFVMINLIVFIINNAGYLSEYPLYVSGLMMIGLYVVGVFVFAGMFSVGSELFKR